MNDYCPDCGMELNEPIDLRTHWLRLLKCTKCSNTFYLDVASPQWIYPMQRLQLGVGQKLVDAEPEVLDKAISRIRRIDYKTVSIVDFEHTLLGCYDPSRSYKIVYTGDPNERTEQNNSGSPD